MIYESCYEMQGLLVAFKGKSNYKALQPCIETNPTYMYPIGHKIVTILSKNYTGKKCSLEFIEK